MPHHYQGRWKGGECPDFSDTQIHIFKAGRELLRAAVGVLKFCRNYVEKTSPEKPHPNLVNFFTKAISVASDLGSSMVKGLPFKQATWKFTKPLCDTIEEEMSQQKASRARKPKIARKPGRMVIKKSRKRRK